MLVMLSLRLLIRRKIAIGKRYLCSSFRHRTYGYIGQLQSANTKGIEYLRNPRLNKDLGFTLDERQSLGIHGLLPAAVRSQDEQSELCKINLDKFGNNVSKCTYLYDLLERNEKLFYQILSENISDLLPIVYMPTIGQVCEKNGLFFNQPKGLFINIYDRGHVSEVLMNWEETDVRAVVVTDGERFSNLGDLGAYSMALPVAKTALYTALGGVKPHQCLPVTLDVGTNNEKLLKDPSYVGLRHHRIMGPTYQGFIDEFIEAITERFGPSTVIQFEGFGLQNSLDFLQRYKRKCCVFSDESQCIGTVALAGFLASQAILNKSIKDYRILFLGADEATFAVANMTARHLQKIGLSAMEAKNKMWIFDEYGLLARSRLEGPLNGQKLIYAKDFEPTNSAMDIIKRIKPNVLVGTADTSNSFTPEILYRMAEVNHRPLIFALTDPASKNECASEDVYHHTQGRAIFASSSTFLPEENYSKNCMPGQASTCLVYPGIVLGAIASGLKIITDEIFPIVAACIANNVKEEDRRVGRVFPSLERTRECCLDVAAKICEYAYQEGLASYYPEPQNKRAFVKAHIFNYKYKPLIKHPWDWPEIPESQIDHVKKDYYGRMKNYFFKFNQSPPTFNLDDDKLEKEPPEVEVPKHNFEEIKIVERIPPETLKASKSD